MIDAFIGEAPPTGGLMPRFADLFARDGGESFTGAVARRVGASGAVIVPSGAAGLRIALQELAAAKPTRRVVIVPAYTCPLVVIAVAAAGLKAVACDVVRGGFDLDPGHLARLTGPDTLAVVPTHYGGWIGDVEAVTRVVRACDPAVVVIEDAAQAFGGTLRDKSAGTFGDIGFYSFAVGKGLTLFEGGALVARERAMLERLTARTAASLVVDEGLERYRCLQLIGYHMLYTPGGLRLMFGRDKRKALRAGDDVAAALDVFPDEIAMSPVGAWRQRVGVAALGRLGSHLAACRARAERMKAAIEQIPGFAVFRQADAQACDAQVYVLCESAVLAEAVLGALWPSRLGVGKMFARALPDYPYLQGKLSPSDVPNARDLVQRLVTITTSPLLFPRAERKIVARLRAIAARVRTGTV